MKKMQKYQLLPFKIAVHFFEESVDTDSWDQPASIVNETNMIIASPNESFKMIHTK